MVSTSTVDCSNSVLNLVVWVLALSGLLHPYELDIVAVVA